MSAFREDNQADKSVRQYLTARLEQAAHKDLLKSSDDLVDYLVEIGGLDRTCRDWIDHAPNAALRELLKDHQRKYHLIHSGGGPASHGAGGPSAHHRFGNQHDSAYDPGSPMSQGSQFRSQEPNFTVFLAPAATPDIEAIPVLARTDSERDTHLIDLQIAKSLCGDRIKEGQSVRVCWRETQNDQGNTGQVQCVVSQIHDVNVVFARDFGRSKGEAEAGGSSSSVDKATDYEREWFKNAALLLHAKTEQDVQRIRKRPPEDDDGGQPLAQRQRRGGY